MNKCLIIIFFSFPLICLAQKANLDSLMRISPIEKEDSTKVLNIITISNRLRTERIDYPNARKYVDQAIILANKLHFNKGLFLANISLGYLVRDQGSNKDAIPYLNRAIAIFDEHKELKTNAVLTAKYISVYTAISEVYTEIPDFTNAYNYAAKALALSERYHTQKGLCQITLSILFFRQKNVTEAKAYALSALDEFKKNNQTGEVARAYSFLAQYEYIAKDFPKALSYYQLSYDAYKNIASLYGQRISLFDLSDVCLSMKAYDKADYYAEEALKIISDDDLVASFYVNQLLSNINLEKKQYKLAIQYGNNAVEFALKDKGMQNICDAYGSLYAVYIALKDTANAFVMKEKISVLKDSLYSSEIEKSTADLLKKHESKQKEQQISFLDKQNILNREKLHEEMLLSLTLKKENKLKEIKLQQEMKLKELIRNEDSLNKTKLINETKLNKSLQLENDLILKNRRDEQWIKWLMVFGLLSFSAFGVNYYRSYKLQKIANSRIIQQSNNLEVLLKELHHRVKNNFQLMLAILRMQKRQVKDEMASKALSDCEKRLHAVSVIHDQLYRSDSLKEVILKEYIDNFIQVLYLQYSSIFPNFKYTIQEDESLTVNLDTAVHIGLIVNELMTNAFKYAFVNNPQPQISIQLNRIDKTYYQLSFKDNGIGLPLNELSTTTESLGLKLLYLFAEQLNGSLNYESKEGALFTLKFMSRGVK